MKGKIDKYMELTKPKVTLLNLLVGIACFVLAAFPRVNLLSLAVFSLAGYLTAGGCGVLNCVYDAKVDRLMERTSKRAIPSGDVTPKKALFFGLVLTVVGLAVSYFFFNASTAFMMVLGIAFYLIVYTVMLKRSSPWNVVIGGAAGCFAGLSGWTATGAALSWTPLLVAAIDFLWTPGHLWGLAIKKVREYRGAGIPMLPVAVGVSRASQIVFGLNVVTIGFSFLLPLLGMTGVIYFGIAVLVGMGFFVESRKLLSFPSESQGFRVFLASMPYLACLMLGLVLDKIVFVRLF
jgi:protoheme IX farnesyltransferase